MKVVTGLAGLLACAVVVRLATAGAVLPGIAGPGLMAPMQADHLRNALASGLEAAARQIAAVDRRPAFRTISVLDGEDAIARLAVRRQAGAGRSEIQRIGD